MREFPGIYADSLFESKGPFGSRVGGFRYCTWSLGDLCGYFRGSVQIPWLNQGVL